jgi:hypothetical protein
MTGGSPDGTGAPRQAQTSPIPAMASEIHLRQPYPGEIRKNRLA